MVTMLRDDELDGDDDTDDDEQPLAYTEAYPDAVVHSVDVVVTVTVPASTSVRVE